MKGDLAAQGTALDGIGATCDQLLQVGAGKEWMLAHQECRWCRAGSRAWACCFVTPGTCLNTRLQAVHSIGGASDGIAARLQQLLAKPPPAVTGGEG